MVVDAPRSCLTPRASTLADKMKSKDTTLIGDRAKGGVVEVVGHDDTVLGDVGLELRGEVERPVITAPNH
jgi:hypothetical protein